MTYFEVKIRYSRRADEDSNVLKQQQEVFLINAVNFSHAEKVAITEVEPYATHGMIEVMAIKKVSFEELLLDTEGNHAGKSFYKAKIMLEIIDENCGKVKKLPQAMLVEDTDVPAAHKRVLEHLKDSVWDYTIDDVVKTKIVGYIDNYIN